MECFSETMNGIDLYYWNQSLSEIRKATFSCVIETSRDIPHTGRWRLHSLSRWAGEECLSPAKKRKLQNKERWSQLLSAIKTIFSPDYCQTPLRQGSCLQWIFLFSWKEETQVSRQQCCHSMGKQWKVHLSWPRTPHAGSRSTRQGTRCCFHPCWRDGRGWICSIWK